jgi:heme-degrading monooxygenase HmoA
MIVRINAIQADAAMGPELERRFSERAGEVEHQPGFLGFELLRPTAAGEPYYVYTRWDSEESFRTWTESDAFRRGHAAARSDAPPVAHGSRLLAFDVVQRVVPAAATTAP